MPADPRPESWQQIARALGARMVHHAYCGEHRLAEADPDNCPFCADRDAYLRYVRKAGKPRDPLAGIETTTVPITDVAQPPMARFGEGVVRDAD